jgi:hypothetical protein
VLLLAEAATRKTLVWTFSGGGGGGGGGGWAAVPLTTAQRLRLESSGAGSSAGGWWGNGRAVRRLRALVRGLRLALRDKLGGILPDDSDGGGGGGGKGAPVAAVAVVDPDERWGAVRNLVVGPVFEEIVFRGCMLPLLLHSGSGSGDGATSSSGWSMVAVVWGGPLVFGVAHAHHFLDRYYKSQAAFAASPGQCVRG